VAALNGRSRVALFNGYSQYHVTLQIPAPGIA